MRKNISLTHLSNALPRPILTFTFSLDAPRRCQRIEGSLRDTWNAGAGEPDAPLQMSTVRVKVSEAKGFARPRRFGCFLVDVNGPRMGSRDQRPRAFCFSLGS